MQICILGAGVIGITTAHFLEQKGYHVTIIDRQPGSGLETSFANGGQLSYGHAEPWANPGVLSKILRWSFQKNSPLQWSWRSLSPDMIRWGLKFLEQCTVSHARQNTLRTLRLALYSRLMLTEIRSHLPNLRFHFLQNGILHFFTDQHLLDKAIEQARFQAEYDCPYQLLSARDCLLQEPALAGLAGSLVGGIYHPEDESGDIHLFTERLAGTLKRTRFLYNVNIEKLIKEENRIRAVEISTGRVEADAFVVANGSYSPQLLKPLGIHLPVYPMKGYSISVPLGLGKGPAGSLTDQGSKIVYSRLGNVLRAAGTAEFAGYDTRIVPARISHMKAEMRRVFGDCGDFNKASSWACLRPQTPSGTPILGSTPFSNLYLNTGHGTLGWTLAAGSGKVVADLIDGQQPAISLEGLTL